MKTAIIAIAALLCLQVSKASADFISGDELWEQCKVGITEEIADEGMSYIDKMTGYALPTPKYSVCLSYAMGVIDSMEAAVKDNLLEPLFCMPPAVTNDQIEDIVVKYVENHPEKRHLKGAAIVQAAMVQAFPCDGAQ